MVKILKKEKYDDINGETWSFLPLPTVIWDLETSEVVQYNHAARTKFQIENKPYQIGDLIANDPLRENLHKKLQKLTEEVYLKDVNLVIRGEQYTANIASNKFVSSKGVSLVVTQFYEFDEVGPRNSELEMTENQFKQAIHSAPIPIIIYTEDGHIHLISKYWIDHTKYEFDGEKSLSEWIEYNNLTLEEKYDEDDNSNSTWENSQNVIIPGIYRLKTKDGKELNWNIYTSNLENLADGTKLYISMALDISKQVRINQALIEEQELLKSSNQELEQFAYIASHDLQEPLRSITGYAQLIQRRYGDQLEDRALNFFDSMIRGTERMKAMIQDLLLYSRLRHVDDIDNIVELSTIVTQSKINLSTLIEETGAKLIIGELPKVRGKASQLGQLFQNIIQNAIKFRKDNVPPEIEVASQKMDDVWRISISDNGIGMNSEYVDRIFVMFQRLQSKSKYPGTGIGLAICKKIAENHGGKIWAESEEGVGSTFFIELPIIKEV